jgi:hypothetical protein
MGQPIFQIKQTGATAAGFTAPEEHRLNLFPPFKPILPGKAFLSEL